MLQSQSPHGQFVGMTGKDAPDGKLSTCKLLNHGLKHLEQHPTMYNDVTWYVLAPKLAANTKDNSTLFKALLFLLMTEL
jgi:hypothetical protein